MTRNWMRVGPWLVEAVVDEDGHLTTVLRHDDGTKPNEVEEDFGEGDKELQQRFTTAGIEMLYESQENPD